MRAAAIILAALLCGCAVTWQDSHGRQADGRDHMECEQEGDRATAGQMSMAAAFDRARIIHNCLRLRGFQPVAR